MLLDIYGPSARYDMLLSLSLCCALSGLVVGMVVLLMLLYSLKFLGPSELGFIFQPVISM